MADPSPTALPPGLARDPFAWQVVRGHVRVSRSGRLVREIGGAAGEHLAARLASADEAAVQHLLARATGDYRRGNERRTRRR